MQLNEIYTQLRIGANKLAQLSSGQKNQALLSVCKALDSNRKSILAANEKDVIAARADNMNESLIDRLSLSDERLNAIIDSIHVVINQTDPIGTTVAGWTTPEGLSINQIRVPIGVAAIIYESRPNVTVDVFSLAYKSGNAILLRGSSSALNSNKALVSAIIEGLQNLGKNPDGSYIGIPEAVALADSGKHEEVEDIITAVGKIDVALPRGSANLIKTVVAKAKVPVIETGSGVCHLFVDESADLDRAALIAENAKLQRPGVCNAIETLLVHKSVIKEFLPKLVKVLNGRAQLRCCKNTYSIVDDSAKKQGISTDVREATKDDFGFEFLDKILAIKSVDSVEEAIEHINSHSTKHSESILTNNVANAKLFQSKVDSACVYVNASTRFTDGGVFGYGAEFGISTQKFHIRGPMGLNALTSTKYLIQGNGNIR